MGDRFNFRKRNKGPWPSRPRRGKRRVFRSLSDLIVIGVVAVLILPRLFGTTSLFTNSTTSTFTDSTTRVCAGKRYCREMADCAEAEHYFQNCGLSRLDGDSDGVPCENLCR